MQTSLGSTGATDQSLRALGGPACVGSMVGRWGTCPPSLGPRRMFGLEALDFGPPACSRVRCQTRDGGSPQAQSACMHQTAQAAGNPH